MSKCIINNKIRQEYNKNLINNPENREKQAYIKKGEMIFQKRKTLISNVNYIFGLIIKVYKYEKYYPKEVYDFEINFNGKINSYMHNNNFNKENLNTSNLNNLNKENSKSEILDKKFAHSELQKFFIENKIFFDKENHNLITKSKISEFLLNQVKLWIAFIIVLKDKKINCDKNSISSNNNSTININSNKLYENINYLNKIFENALKRKIDKIFLFEYFIIFLSEQNTLALLNANFLENKPENYLDNDNIFNDFDNKNEIFIPNDFIEIYYNNREELKNLFNENEENCKVEKKYIYKNQNQSMFDTEKIIYSNKNNSVISTKNSSMICFTKNINEENENCILHQPNIPPNNHILSKKTIIHNSDKIKKKNEETIKGIIVNFEKNNNPSLIENDKNIKNINFLDNNPIDEKFNLESVKSERHDELSCKENNFFIENNNNKLNGLNNNKNNNNFFENSDFINLNFNNFNNLMNNSDFVQINKNEFSFFTKDKTEDSQFFLRYDRMMNLDSEILNINIKNPLEDENSNSIKQSEKTNKICNISKLNLSSFNSSDQTNNNQSNNIGNINDSFNLMTYKKEIEERNLPKININQNKRILNIENKSEEKLKKIQVEVTNSILNDDLLIANSFNNNIFKEDLIEVNFNLNKQKQDCMNSLEFCNEGVIKDENSIEIVRKKKLISNVGKNFCETNFNKESNKKEFFEGNEIISEERILNDNKINLSNNHFIFLSPDKKPKKLIIYKEVQNDINQNQVKNNSNNKNNQEKIEYKNPFSIQFNKIKEEDNKENFKISKNYDKSIKKNTISNSVYSDSKSFLNTFNKKMNLLLKKDSIKKNNPYSISEKNNKNYLLSSKNQKSFSIDDSESILQNEKDLIKEDNLILTERSSRCDSVHKDRVEKNENQSLYNEDEKPLCEEEIVKNNIKELENEKNYYMKEKNLFLLESINIDSPLNLFNMNIEDNNSKSQITDFLKNPEFVNPKSPSLNNYLIPTQKSNSSLNPIEKLNEKSIVLNYHNKDEEANEKNSNLCLNNKKNESIYQLKSIKNRLNNSDDFSEKKYTDKKNSIRKNYKFNEIPIKNFNEIYFYENEECISSNKKNILSNGNMNFSFNYHSNKLQNSSNFKQETSFHYLVTPEKSIISNQTIKPYEDYRGPINSKMKTLEKNNNTEKSKNSFFEYKNHINNVNEFPNINKLEFSKSNIKDNYSNETNFSMIEEIEIKNKINNCLENYKISQNIKKENTEIIQANIISNKNFMNEKGRDLISSNETVFSINMIDDNKKKKMIDLKISNECLELKNNVNNENEEYEHFEYKNYLNFDNFDIVDKNFLHHNNICLLELKKILKIILKCEYAIFPLKEKFENLNERLDLLSDLNFLSLTKFSDFCYLPYNKVVIDIINLQ